MRRFFTAGLVAGAMAFGVSTPAAASGDVEFVLTSTGGDFLAIFTELRWVLPRNPAPTLVARAGFTLSGVEISGELGGTRNLAFFVPPDEQLQILDPEPTFDLRLFGPALFSGPFATPEFLLGTFDFSGSYAEEPDFDIDPRLGTARLVISELAHAPGVIPEPASWAMLIAGFGLVGMALRRRPALA